MDNVIRIDSVLPKPIDMAAFQKNNLKLKAGLIAPAKEEVTMELAPEHSADPIKSLDDIMKISKYLIQEERWRDNMLFIVGINFGLRVSDLLTLRFTNLITDSFEFRESFPIWEKKTRTTRAKKRNRYITINSAVRDAVTLYLEHTPGVCLSDYMFRSESNHGKASNKPMHRNSVERILKGIGEDLDLQWHMSTHTLRKTFGFHQMVMSNNDPRKLMLLSKMLGHSSLAITMQYIGITDDEIRDAYKELNLGSEACNYMNSDIGEVVALVG